MLSPGHPTDGEDRNDYLARVAWYRAKFGFRLLAYCLMTNHVHLAIRRGPAPLSRVMAGLHSSYTQWFNRRHRRVGHLFQGRYKSFPNEGHEIARRATGRANEESSRWKRLAMRRLEIPPARAAT